MEKNELLRVRVTAKLKSEFEDICKTFGGSAPADMLREIVEKFVSDNLDRLGDRIVVHIYRPEGYDLGAWRVFIKLRDPGEGIWHGSVIPFTLPEFKQRRLASDEDYRSVVGIPDNEKFVKYELGGVFKDGEWRGHLYSNGVAEEKNPTGIEIVKKGLVEHLVAHLDKFK